MKANASRYGFGMVALAGLACLGGAQAMAGNAVPIKGNYSGIAWLEPDFTGAHCNGSGNISHLGLVSTECDAVFLDYGPMDECAGTGTGWGIPNLNTAVMTAANGDQLVLVLDDLACEISIATEYQATGQWYVDGTRSTGRFAGATGTGLMVGRVNFATGIFACDIAGTIFY